MFRRSFFPYWQRVGKLLLLLLLLLYTPEYARSFGSEVRKTSRVWRGGTGRFFQAKRYPASASQLEYRWLCDVQWRNFLGCQRAK